MDRTRQPSPVLRDELTAALRRALGAVGVAAPDEIASERPARREHGDWSSNVALATAKAAGRNPRELAQAVAEHLDADLPAHVDRVEIAGPGFVNFRLADTWLHDVLAEVVTGGVDGYARPDSATAGTSTSSSSSPTRPARIHAGHGRGACLRRLARPPARACGYDVHREYYLNDRGTQMQLVRRLAGGPRARASAPPEDGYHGEYIIEWAAEMPDDADPLEWGEARALADQREVLGRWTSHFDTWFSERSLVESGAMDDDPRRPARPGRRLRGRRRRVVAQHRLRRRQGPRARQDRRRVHLPAARHRLPPRQVRPRLRAAHRRVGRRPPRLRAPG